MARILFVNKLRRNFGCGSSGTCPANAADALGIRAVWARALVAGSSLGNCLRWGFLLQVSA